MLFWYARVRMRQSKEVLDDARAFIEGGLAACFSLEVQGGYEEHFALDPRCQSKKGGVVGDHRRGAVTQSQARRWPRDLGRSPHGHTRGQGRLVENESPVDLQVQIVDGCGSLLGSRRRLRSGSGGSGGGGGGRRLLAGPGFVVAAERLLEDGVAAHHAHPRHHEDQVAVFTAGTQPELGAAPREHSSAKRA